MNAFELRAALMRSGQPLGAKAVGVVILDHQGRSDGVCKLSQPKIADACGMSVEGVRSALKRLRAAGWIDTPQSTHNRAWRRLRFPASAGVSAGVTTPPVPKLEGVSPHPVPGAVTPPTGCHHTPTEERTSERTLETTTPPLPPRGADDGFGAVEAQREEWRSAIVRGWPDRHPGGFASATNDPALMPAVLACVEWHDRQPPGVDVDAAVGGMLDRFFAAKSRYRRVRLAWLAEDVGAYIEPQHPDRSRLPDGSRRRTFRQPPCQLTEAGIDNSHSESILGSVVLPDDEPGPPSLRLVGGAR